MDKKVLLYSGGTDSWLIDKIWKPDVKLYIDIHGRYSECEKKLLEGKNVEIMDVPFLGKTEVGHDGYVPFRNLYFLMMAKQYGTKICLGATAGDCGCPDKTKNFLIEAQRMLNMVDGKCQRYPQHEDVEVVMDFVDMSKFDLLKKYLEMGGNLDYFVKDTFSCHDPVDGEECFQCKCCYKKFLQTYYFGYEYTREQEDKMIDYLIKNELKTSESSHTVLNRPYEGEFFSKAIHKLFSSHNLCVEDYL